MVSYNPNNWNPHTSVQNIQYLNGFQYFGADYNLMGGSDTRLPISFDDIVRDTTESQLIPIVDSNNNFETYAIHIGDGKPTNTGDINHLGFIKYQFGNQIPNSTMMYGTQDWFSDHVSYPDEVNPYTGSFVASNDDPTKWTDLYSNLPGQSMAWANGDYEAIFSFWVRMDSTPNGNAYDYLNIWFQKYVGNGDWADINSNWSGTCNFYNNSVPKNPKHWYYVFGRVKPNSSAYKFFTDVGQDWQNNWAKNARFAIIVPPGAVSDISFTMVSKNGDTTDNLWNSIKKFPNCITPSGISIFG